MKNVTRLVLVSGCSGGGKSTLLAELAARGHHVVAEPGRRIVAEERAKGGSALPWIDMAAFARRAVKMALDDLVEASKLSGTVFFDRGLVDALVALDDSTGEADWSLARDHRYDVTGFMAPPWPDIYSPDEDRRHGFEVATEGYERLRSAYAKLGYRTVELPKVCVAERASFVLSRLGRAD